MSKPQRKKAGRREKPRGRAAGAFASVAGGLGLVLLSGFDTRETLSAATSAGVRMADVVRAKLAPDRPSRIEEWRAPSGRHEPRGAALTGAATFDGAHIVLERGGAWKTAPVRIARGREAMVRPLGLKDDDQIELRRIADADAAPTVLCQGDRPAWVGVSQTGAELTLMLFREGPPPGQAEAAAALCGWWTYRKP